ncbi:MAG: hypothetical protein LBG62_03875 [Candidatus Methanoplasma sp.]|jgi:hypothetical protein|nr:hypothetical protein [Candidatus Methanoplasma sp.]
MDSKPIWAREDTDGSRSRSDDEWEKTGKAEAQKLLAILQEIREKEGPIEGYGIPKEPAKRGVEDYEPAWLMGDTD